MMTHFAFVAQMPNRPGALHQAAEIAKRYQANINRIHYDRRIDPQTVFFEVTATEKAYRCILEELDAIGYLQTGIPRLSFLKFHVHLPHRSGALFEFLNYTTGAGANIAYIDFDESGRNPDRVTVSLSVEESTVADALLNQLKSRYPLEIVEYDTTGEQLDNTVFYIRFAQQLRPLIGEAEEGFLLSFLHDVNHIVQELTAIGKEPQEVFESILEAGLTLHHTTGSGFYADVQHIPIDEDTTLICFQLPCGGNIFVFDTPGEKVMIDTGYGIYHPDVMRMLEHYGLGTIGAFRQIIVTHGDADHCGAGGFFDIPCTMHPETLEVIQKNNRAYGSRNEDSILEEVYTTMIALFSRCTPPGDVRLVPTAANECRSGFPIIDRLTIGKIEFEVLESLGGHQVGQLYLYAPDAGLLFTADSLMNFASFTRERRRYNSIADFLITSVNVDSDLAREERKGLIALAAETDAQLANRGTRCLICGGHGAVSIQKEGTLMSIGGEEHYTHPGTP